MKHFVHSTLIPFGFVLFFLVRLFVQRLLLRESLGDLLVVPDPGELEAQFLCMLSCTFFFFFPLGESLWLSQDSQRGVGLQKLMNSFFGSLVYGAVKLCMFALTIETQHFM